MTTADRWHLLGWRLFAAGATLFAALVIYFVAVQFGLREYTPISWFLILGSPLLIVSGVFCLNCWIRASRGGDAQP